MSPAHTNKFEDFPSSHDGSHTSRSTPVGEDDIESEDEEQLIKDGNDQVLRSFDTRKKSQDYSRTHAPSRDKKAPEMNLDIVDWGAGFSAAAHRSPGSVTGRKTPGTGTRGKLSGGLPGTNSNIAPPLTESEKLRIQERRSSRNLGVGDEGQEDLNDTSHDSPGKYRNRRHSFRGLSGSNHGGEVGQEGQEELNDASSSPRKSPYRNRRHSLKKTLSGGLSSSNHSNNGDRSRRPSLGKGSDHGLGKGSGHRPLKGRTGSLSNGTTTRVRPTRRDGGARTSPQRRKSDSAMKEKKAGGSLSRSLRKSTHRSTSPSVRIRAKAATVLGDATRTKTPTRNGSTGRRQRSQRQADGSSRALKVADDGVIAAKKQGIKW